jgi:hypothetical protein
LEGETKARRAAAAHERAGLAFVFVEFKYNAFPPMLLKNLGLLLCQFLSGVMSVGENLRKEAEQCPSTSMAIGQK